MKFTDHKNKLRKYFVIKMFIKKPSTLELTNVEISRRVRFKYGVGMTNAGINKCRSIAARSIEIDRQNGKTPKTKKVIREFITPKHVAYDAMHTVNKKTVNTPRPVSKSEAKKLVTPFPPEVQEALENLKTKVSSHYNGGILYMNISPTGEAQVKYHLQPKTPVPTSGKVTL